ncbi:unnamed protein product [Tetraodon nigroviridis]|uniref:(spotted green pufferfish) hypothetical protein n=1 Tax=Tetraodon nigroviridis TaxID=99883 RepID=Q4T8S0_TETNG|nr:unnamed protein product [Tetraodon nigroviridis]
MEEEDRAECPESSCVSLKSDRSKDIPLNFRDEAGPSNPESALKQFTEASRRTFFMVIDASVNLKAHSS